MTYEGQIAESLTIRGHEGDSIEAYYARPLGPGPFPGVVVIHHMPGWDEWTREVTRKLAHNGYAAIAPHLFSRFGPGDPDDVAAKARTAGGVADAQVIGDIAGAVASLKAQPWSNGKVGVIGFCSGGRQTYMVACSLDIDAAVDCWGGGVIPADPSQVTDRRISVIDLTPDLRCPLLGIFGNDDANPDPEQVNKTEELLKQHGKQYEFYRYDGAGHGFFGWYRPGYRQEQALDGWNRVFDFFGRHLNAEVPATAAAR